MDEAAMCSVQYTPEKCLTIKVVDGEPAEAVLKITNLSPQNIAFKVKTTSPERYLVKPNHGLIRRGRQTEIVIIIVHAKKQDILSETPMRCSDKFLVQSCGIDDELANDLESKTSHEVAETITRLLVKKDKRDLRAKKLPVELLFAKPVGNGSSNNVRPLHKALEATISSPMPGTPEAMFAEIVTLRKKYDDLVAFTVNLTAERDSLSADLANSRSSSPESHSHPLEVKPNKTGLYKKPDGAYSSAFVIALCLISCIAGWCTASSTQTCGG